MLDLATYLVYGFGMLICDITVMILQVSFSGLELSRIIHGKEKIKLFHVILFTLTVMTLIPLSYFLLIKFPIVYIIGSFLYLIFSMIAYREDKIWAWLLFSIGFIRLLASTFVIP